ncbi:hypothetical protein N7474_002177 [Penicillium riverlandense]|uniref:uncharacterized protein n=1 Tax=Penicillium riverlandense TaxID=1903569 RepID=UPI0025484F45|nr:uncharacterized protein N7474_002177 [Penicillium riverlandense]KAJ5833866.1 hypothetical protein N7474_002177 [Penicillium riverlandense]
MSDDTFRVTRQDVRKPESRIAKQHHGKTPANSDVSAMKSLIDEKTDKSQEIDKVKADLPLPEQPPVASDWSSSDQRTVNVGSGRFEGPISGSSESALRDPATVASSARISGEELHKATAPGKDVGEPSNLSSDATSRT